MVNFFAVVHFIATDEVELVPIKWIKERCELEGDEDVEDTTHIEGGEAVEIKLCYWPNFKKEGKICAAVKGLKSPIKSMWMLYKIRVLHKFQTFEEGKRKLPHFEVFSELSADETYLKEPIRKSRAGRSIQKRKLSFSSDSNENIDLENVPNTFRLGPMDPPIFQTNSEIVLEFPSSVSLTESTSSGLENSVHASSLSTPGNTTCFENVPEPFLKRFEDFQRNVFLKLSILQTNQDTMQAAIFSLVNNARVYNMEREVSSPLPAEVDFNFPFTTMNQLLQFDQKLKEDLKFKKSALLYLGSLGGSDLTETVYNILKEVMSFDLAYRFNYTGVRGKPNFSILHINDFIYEIVKANPKTVTETRTAARSKIMAWIQHAGDKLTKVEKAAARLLNSSADSEQL